MKSRYVKSFAVAGFAALGVLPVLVQAQLVDLGSATGYAINNAGQVALSTGIYSNGAVTPLPALPGYTTPVTPFAINASGQVAASGPSEYSGGTLTKLLPSSYSGPQGADGGPATGINSSSTIVGWVDLFATEGPGADTIGFIYSNGVLTQLPVPSWCGGGQYSNMPAAINDSGQLTGTFGCTVVGPYEGTQPYIYNQGVYTNLGFGAAYAINMSGEVTGNQQVFQNGEGPGNGSGGVISGTYAFLYTNGKTSNLGTLPGGKHSTGYDINGTGQIVGSSDFTGSAATHGFFYNGVMTDLNSLVSASDPLQPFVTLSSGVAINDSRLILANGVDSRTGTTTHAYLLQGPWINVGPRALTFATVLVGATSPTQSITVSNSGTSAIALGTIAATTNFSIESNSCGTSLAPGGQCTIAVAFTPDTAGATTGAVTVPSAGVNYSVALGGSATISGSLVASAKAVTVGQPLILTWKASAGSICIATSSSTNTAWTASKPPFTGSVPASGQRTLTETVDGTVTYAFICSVPGTNGSSVVNASTSVVWTWPAVTATIAASPTTITAGQSTTLTWKSSSATTCTATGGGADDNWAGTKTTSGSQTITEAVALDTSSVVLTFGLTCSSTISGLSAKATANVTEKQAPSGSGGGGGALNPLSLAFLAGILALRRVRIRIASR
jgi:probable HAF family extracellular repeat protein